MHNTFVSNRKKMYFRDVLTRINSKLSGKLPALDFRRVILFKCLIRFVNLMSYLRFIKFYQIITNVG